MRSRCLQGLISSDLTESHRRAGGLRRSAHAAGQVPVRLPDPARRRRPAARRRAGAAARRCCSASRCTGCARRSSSRTRATRFAVAAVLGEGAAARFDLPERAGACRAFDEGLACVDPRLARLGVRVVLPPERIEPALAGARASRRSSPPPTSACGSSLGVPDGSRDLVVERSTLLESGFEELHGVDFAKGCFVGQELTARMKYRGLVAQAPAAGACSRGRRPEPGTIIRHGEREVGEMRSSIDGRGLALLRLDRIAEAAQSAHAAPRRRHRGHAGHARLGRGWALPGARRPSAAASVRSSRASSRSRRNGDCPRAAPRRPDSRARPAGPGGRTRRAAPRAARPRPGPRACARAGARRRGTRRDRRAASISASIPCPSCAADQQDRHRPALAGRRRELEGRLDVAPWPCCGERAEIGLGDHDDVGDLGDAGLHVLQAVAGARLHAEHDRVGRPRRPRSRTGRRPPSRRSPGRRPRASARPPPGSARRARRAGRASPSSARTRPGPRGRPRCGRDRRAAHPRCGARTDRP